MKSILFRIYLAIMKFMASMIKEDPNSYVILNGAGRSGSNGYLFYKYLKENHPEVTASLIEPWPSSHLPWSDWKKIGQAKYVFTTHQPFKVRKSQINVAFWHGIPLKRMNVMANNTNHRDNARNERLWHNTADVVVSSSDLYESLMSACMSIEGKKYHKLGFPRIDYLLNSTYSKKDLLREFFDVSDQDAQVGIYMPTFRWELEDKTILKKIGEGNFFAFEDFDLSELEATLESNNQYLLVKLHPYEMRLFDSFESSVSHISFLNNNDLDRLGLDLYEMISATDFLITDYSSIYFDYLHLDHPIIFITNFLKQYKKTRGFLLGPYEDIIPGVCANNQKELLGRLTNLDEDGRFFKDKRHQWLKLSDSVDDGKVCEKIFEYLN